jgi:hypothetical protein
MAFKETYAWRDLEPACLPASLSVTLRRPVDEQ